MDRRSFLKSAGAAATAPLLPLRAMAAAAPSASVSQFQVGFAALYARVNARATPELIQKWLRVDGSQAHLVMDQLVQRGVLQAPVAGSAAAVQPMYPSGNAPGVFKGTVEGGQKALRRVAEFLDEDEPTVMEETAGAEETTCTGTCEEVTDTHEET